MKIRRLTFAMTASAMFLTGCQYPNGEPNRTANGAMIGGGTGALTGATVGGGEGALIGATAGAVIGGVVGSTMDQQQRERLQTQAPQTYARVEQGQPLLVSDVKAMAKAGVSDDVVISQIQTSHTIYRLTASDIIDLHNAGVNNRVIDFMINTANTSSTTSTAAIADPSSTVVANAPPPPPTEIYVTSPGPGYVWISGDWVWNGRWVWAAGRWAYPPYPRAIWVRGYWYHGSRGWYHQSGHWRR